MSTTQVPAQVLNQLFVQRLDTDAGKEKIASASGSYIKKRLREESFARKVLPPQQVTPAECRPSMQHDTLAKVEEIEPDSKAMTVTFRGEATARLISGKRFEIPFFAIESEHFEKWVQELMAYQMPITKIIEQNSVKDIQELEDRQFLVYVETAIQAVQDEINTNTAINFNTTQVNAGHASAQEYSIIKGQGCKDDEASGGSGASMTVHPIEKSDFVRLFQRFTAGGRRMVPAVLLMTDYDFASMHLWLVEEIGTKLASEITVDGYKYNQVLGKRFIRTVKTDILREGNVYCFAAPDYFGRNYTLEPIQFYIDKVGRKITWWAWETIGMGIGNVLGACKAELYSGSVRPTATDADFADRIPQEETELGDAVNDILDNAGTFPEVFDW